MIYDYISGYITPANSKIAIYDSNLTAYTYLQFHHKISQIEIYYKQNGLSKGSLLILQTDKSFESLAHLYCCIKMGIIYIPVDVDTPSERLTNIILLSKSNAILKSDFSIHQLSNETIFVPDDVLCVLYTSGSTGIPKGVMCTSSGTKAFVEWGISEFKVDSDDTLTAYAPYHFDLSTFDIFASLAAGASVWLINKPLSANIRLLGESILKISPTIWYATPTVYKLLLQHGKLPDNYCPRICLFAGEVFPVKTLNKLREKWLSCQMYNLYGPTETNVCTYFKLPEIIETTRKSPYPIGIPCPYAQIQASPSGELLVAGKSIMSGYLNDPSATEQKLFDQDGIKWLHTGDQVEIENNNYVYKGRRDRMIKRNGYRIELGEIEHALIQHPQISSIVCTNMVDSEGNIRILALYEGDKISPLSLKTFANQKLLTYMIPDQFIHTEHIPINSNGKIDYMQIINTFKLSE